MHAYTHAYTHIHARTHTHAHMGGDSSAELGRLDSPRPRAVCETLKSFRMTDTMLAPAALPDLGWFLAQCPHLVSIFFLGFFLHIVEPLCAHANTSTHTRARARARAHTHTHTGDLSLDGSRQPGCLGRLGHPSHRTRMCA